jgi:hypothetical protein
MAAPRPPRSVEPSKVRARPLLRGCGLRCVDRRGTSR